MRNIVAGPVKGEEYFNRPRVVGQILNLLDTRSNLLITGPRRCGKTSLLFHLKDTLKTDYTPIYIDLMATENETFFYVKLLQEIYRNDGFSELNVPKDWGERIANLEKEKSNKSGGQAEIGAPEKYKRLFVQFLECFPNDKRLVIMLDEFSTLAGRILHGSGEERLASFLQESKEIRFQFIDHVQFIYTGAPYLIHMLDKLNLLNSINDLNDFNIPSLSPNESVHLFLSLVHNHFQDTSLYTVYSLFLKKEYKKGTDSFLAIAIIEHTLQNMAIRTLFHFQLLFQEIRNISVENERIFFELPDIDKAFTRLQENRMLADFYVENLKYHLDTQEYHFSNELLDRLTTANKLHTRSIGRIAEKFGVRNRFRKLLDVLVRDGYLNNDEGPEFYRFHSALMKHWWRLQGSSGLDSDVDSRSKKSKKFKKAVVKNLTIRNIKCFDEIDIRFDSPSNMSLITGPNAKGKTTILQLIALGLSNVNTVPFPYCWKQVVKNNGDQGEFEIDLQIEDENVHLKYKIGLGDDVVCVEGAEKLKAYRDDLFVLAYGANRHIKLEDPRPYEEIEAIATLFGENGYLKHIKVSENFEYVRKNFNIVKKLINRVLEKSELENKILLKDYDFNSLYFETLSNPEKPIPTEALSEGLKSTIVWLFDMIIRVVERGGDLKNAAETTGIVLLDEVDLHLHPSWQRTILPSIRDLFPNIQFILTSHSLFIAQSVKSQGIVSLQWDRETNRVVVEDKDVSSGLSYKAVGREIFNIQSPFSHEVEKKIENFREMKSAIRRNQEIDLDKFVELVLDIASGGVELEGVMRREIQDLERRTGKNFGLWKK